MKEDKIINTTPHAITVVAPDGRLVVSIPPSGQVWRLQSHTEPLRDFMFGGVAISLSSTKYDAPIIVDSEGRELSRGWPPARPGIYYIVSQLVKAAAPNRLDLLVPAEMQRDKEGRILGCLSLGL
jgi:hypothetical protein